MTAQTKAKKARNKLRTRDIRMTVMRVVLPDTGEMIGALVPDHPIDRRSMKERRLYVGKSVRATLREDRNPGWWRKAHVLGGWLADNVEAFSGLDMHQALKKLQVDSGIGVEVKVEQFDVPEIGLKGTRTVNEPLSLNVSEMDEGEWAALWDGGNGEGGWIGWLRANVFGGLDATSREDVEAIIQKPEGA